MNIDIIASTAPGHIVKKSELDDFCGKIAGVCYMSSSFRDLLDESPTKTQKRIDRTKNGKHHSVYEHGYISLYLENIPKLFAMVLNNEKVYVTSEKSARYTLMTPSPLEQQSYDKWKNIFLIEINKRYPNDNSFFNKTKREKLAQENARYLISAMTPTSMVYTTSYRQLNYLCQMIQNEIERPNGPYKLLKPHFAEFVDFVKTQGFYDPALADDGKNRHLSLVSSVIRNDYYGDVYCTSYDGSLAQLAQAQRHRTISYQVNLSELKGFYVPPILKNNPDLAREWLLDMYTLQHLLPQGSMFNITERGLLENFILKAKERLCSNAQLEIDNQTSTTLKKYLQGVNQDEYLYSQLEPYSHGSRCTFPDYICPQPCGFYEGVTGEREI